MRSGMKKYRQGRQLVSRRYLDFELYSPASQIFFGEVAYLGFLNPCEKMDETLAYSNPAKHSSFAIGFTLPRLSSFALLESSFFCFGE